MKSIAILNSRQNLRPVGSNEWIIKTHQAVKAASARNSTLLTSTGMSTWEMVLYLASRYGIRRKIYIPEIINHEAKKSKEYYINQFRLKPELTDWAEIEINHAQRDYHHFQRERDRLIIESADIVYPVSLRRGSTLQALIKKNDNNAVIDNSCRTEYEKSADSCLKRVETDKLNSELDNRLDDFIIHWTRTSNSPWPGETHYEYYEAIINSNNFYPRSALETLKRILTENTIRASIRHYRKGFPAVAFSELKPSEAAKLMKWRARYREMTFEPYGIAVRKSTGLELGVRPVIYGSSVEYKNLADSDKPYFQSVGKKGFWLPEKEWRHIGDFKLDRVSPGDLKFLVLQAGEIDNLDGLIESEILPLYQ